MTPNLDELKKAASELQKSMDALKKQIKALENPTGAKEKWKPKSKEDYYVPGLDDSLVAHSSWSGSELDERLLRAGLLCKTREEAIELGRKFYYRQWLESLSDITPDMWTASGSVKYTAAWNLSLGSVVVAAHCSRREGLAYFSDDEKARAAIDIIGAENLKKYVLGITEGVANGTKQRMPNSPF